jgi:hypothetical protein
MFSIETWLAVAAVLTAGGAWLAIRWAEESARIDRTITEVLMSIDLRDESEVDAEVRR